MVGEDESISIRLAVTEDPGEDLLALDEVLTRFTALKASDAYAAGAAAGPGGATAPAFDMTILGAMDNAIADLDSGRFKDDPQTEAGIRQTIGLILLNNGKYDKARLLLEQVLEIARAAVQ